MQSLAAAAKKAWDSNKALVGKVGTFGEFGSWTVPVSAAATTRVERVFCAFSQFC